MNSGFEPWPGILGKTLLSYWINVHYFQGREVLLSLARKHKHEKSIKAIADAVNDNEYVYDRWTNT